MFGLVQEHYGKRRLFKGTVEGTLSRKDSCKKVGDRKTTTIDRHNVLDESRRWPIVVVVFVPCLPMLDSEGAYSKRTG